MGQITQKQKKQLLITLISAAFLLSLYGLYQFFWGFQDVLDYLHQTESYPYAEEFLSRKRVFATFFSPDMFAGYLIMTIPLAAGLFLENLIKKKRLFCLLTGLSVSFMLFSFLLTKSIGALISLMISFLVFSSLLFVFSPLLRPKIFFITAIIGIIAISMLAGLLLLRADYFFDFSNPHNPIVQRLYFWKSTIKMIKDFPLTGVGLGNFGLVYPQYQSPQGFATNFAHNSYLQIWAEIGILGIIAWLWLGISSLGVGLRRLKVLPEQNYLLVSLVAASSAFLVHNLIDFTFFISEVSFHWWMILGLICFWPSNGAKNSSIFSNYD